LDLPANPDFYKRINSELSILSEVSFGSKNFVGNNYFYNLVNQVVKLTRNHYFVRLTDNRTELVEGNRPSFFLGDKKDAIIYKGVLRNRNVLVYCTNRKYYTLFDVKTRKRILHFRFDTYFMDSTLIKSNQRLENFQLATLRIGNEMRVLQKFDPFQRRIIHTISSEQVNPDVSDQIVSYCSSKFSLEKGSDTQSPCVVLLLRNTIIPKDCHTLMIYNLDNPALPISGSRRDVLRGFRLLYSSKRDNTFYLVSDHSVQLMHVHSHDCKVKIAFGPCLKLKKLLGRDVIVELEERGDMLDLIELHTRFSNTYILKLNC